MNLASSSRLSAAAALLTDRPIRNARVPQAIGQSFDWLVPAEAEVLGAGVADRPAAFPLAELEQRASASDRDVFSRRLRPRERRHQHLMLGEDVQAPAPYAPSPWNLGARKPCGTPLLQLPADHILGPRQAQAVLRLRLMDRDVPALTAVSTSPRIKGAPRDLIRFHY